MFDLCILAAVILTVVATLSFLLIVYRKRKAVKIVANDDNFVDDDLTKTLINK